MAGQLRRRSNKGAPNVHESFSDIALMMLGTFVFLLVVILITSRMSEQNELPKLKKQLEAMQKELKVAETDKSRLKHDLEKILITDPEGEVDIILNAASVGRKDFDLFIEGLKDIPGKELHMVVDASGSMHGVSSFLIPILRLIAVRSDKHLSAVTWFSDRTTQTYTGTMGEMFDNLMSGAPFAGNIENIGLAFRMAQENAPLPSAYLLIGDEPSDDTIQYNEIPRPVFTLPLGRSDPYTERAYQALAQKTGGKMLMLDFK